MRPQFMKQFFGILMISSVAFGSHANNVIGEPNSEKSVIIYSEVKTNMLSIQVDDQLAGTSVTVSIFNSIGEIVLENTLGLGLNKISVAGLEKGEYIAVVRENGVYTSKSSFEVK
ncbi:MAG: hypothetical protein GC178_14745 [Flavobacteriales bacterium]|nr:hypothetical protein [Flavobacteriales bacterium]